MRQLTYVFILTFTMLYNKALAQNISANTCDSTILTKQEFEKCLIDSVFNADIAIKVNYITNFKSALLPKYRVLRKGIHLPVELERSLRSLRTLYETVLRHKYAEFLSDMDRNQKYIQPKAYISSLLSLQILNFYPDVYAVLLNDIHLILNPKTSTDEHKYYLQLVDTLYKNIPKDLLKDLEQITTAFANDNNELMKNGFMPMLQGALPEEYQKKYRIINFILWDK